MKRKRERESDDERNLFSPVETNQHTIDCYARENALQKPRNLNKLEQERKLLSKIGGSGAQFTVSIPPFIPLPSNLLSDDQC